MQTPRWFILVTIVCLFVLSSSAQSEPIKIVATTTIIADMAKNVGGHLVAVTALVPPEADAHAFQPRPSDIVMLSDADVVLVNGLGLEGFLDDLISSAGVEPIVVTQGIEPIVFSDEDDDEATCENGHEEEADSDEEHHGECDPHVWNNPLNALVMVDNITEALIEIDPDHAEIYRENAENYQAEILELDAELEALLTEIPDEERLLVTNHNFMGYFAERYNFTIVGTVIPGLSTLAEPNPRELATLIQTMRETGISAIFVEITATESLSQTLRSEIGDEVQIIGLYSEALSSEDGEASTYLDYMMFNATAIFSSFDG